MGKRYDRLDPPLIEWIDEQPLFFVATAPREGGHVNVSPKGLDTFRVLDPLTVAYLDLTGSGIETIAHLRDNGRVTFMFCAFEGRPKILRLFGVGEAVTPDDGRFEELRGHFPDLPGTRAIIRTRLERVQTSCGFGVPLMDVREHRSMLEDWATNRGPDGLVAYRAERNAHSIDGLPGLV